jgi:hypothetical protein
MVVVDIEKFGRRPDPVQAWLRQCLYELLDRAFDEAGIDHRSAPRPEDRGDGLFWLLPGSVPKTRLLGGFVERLRVQLRSHAQLSSETAALRLRLSLHAGEVAWDGRGWVGSDLNTACRMVDMDPLRATLAAEADAELALVIDDSWYRSVVSHDYPEIDPAGFSPIRLDAKEISGATVWIQVPGHRPPASAAQPADAPPHEVAGAAAADIRHRGRGVPVTAESGSTVGQQIGVSHGEVSQHSPVYHVDGDGSSGSGNVFNISGQGNSVHGDVTNHHNSADREQK